MRRYFFAGLLIWVPIAVTVFIIKLLLDLMGRVFGLLPPAWRPENWLDGYLPGNHFFAPVLSVVIALAVLLLTGVLGANLIGRRLVALYEAVLERIPFIRSIYSTTKGMAEMVFSTTERSFTRVVLIEYPRSGMYAIAFRMADTLEEVQMRTSRDVICVFLPRPPNPLSGLVLLVPREDAIELDMNVEDAMKMILSLGAVVPKWQARELAPDQIQP